MPEKFESAFNRAYQMNKEVAGGVSFRQLDVLTSVVALMTWHNFVIRFLKK